VSGRRPTTLLVVALASASLLAGCNSGSEKMVRTGSQPARITADNRLDSDPSPLSLADVARFRAGSPQRAVMQLMFWAQWGNFPAIPDSYDSRVVRRLGIPRITDSYSWLAPSLVSAKPRFVAYRRVGRDAFLGMELLTRQYAPTRDSFVLHPSSAGWKIVWDTLLARSLSGYTTSRLVPNSGTPSLRARRAGDAAAKAYRDVYPVLARTAARSPRKP
jgi:hypothetical protein